MDDLGVQTAIRQFAAFLRSQPHDFFLTDQLQRALRSFFDEQTGLPASQITALRKMFRGAPEAFFEGDLLYAILRPEIGRSVCIAYSSSSNHVEEIPRGEYLRFKDALRQGHDVADRNGMVIDFRPFFRDFPKISEPSEMGSGISFLNRHLSALLYQNRDRFRSALLDYLQNRELAGRPIFINGHIETPNQLETEVQACRSLLADLPVETPLADIEHELRTRGLEPGWGSTAGSIRKTLKLLAQVMNAADPGRLERLLGQLPVIRTVLMVSPHGWFAQDNVLGKPDTGGQVTYALDQARALERAMVEHLQSRGLDIAPRVAILTRLIPQAEGTTCDLVREKIHGCEDGWIIRAPFRDLQGEIIPHWISRFHIWPYLEQFAIEGKQLAVTELMGRPDLIIGHYSDGNLVAHRLAEELGVTHCACVHALEKTKYLLSDLHWDEMEPEYRFSMQFTADLLSYNSADFIVSSSKLEVCGTADEQGMIEAYDLFSMPGLYRVESGFDPRLARHNIVPPGASEDHFFPYQEHERRVPAVLQSLKHRFLEAEPHKDSVGRLNDPSLPMIFAMARMDRIKNLSGLVELYGRSESLRRAANLLLISSVLDPGKSHDQEEIAEVRRVHHLIEEHELQGHLRWCAARLDKVETGEIYRIVAEGKGVFAQPAYMETFGLTVVEAMACGLPVVVTCFGGPSEIVVDGDCGFVRDPNDQSAFADALQAIVEDEKTWKRFGTAGGERIRQHFTWSAHAQRLLKLANTYDYWNHLDVMNRQALDRYVHTLYHTVFRPRTQAMAYETATQE